MTPFYQCLRYLYRRRCRTQNAGFLHSFSVVLFLLPLFLAHTAYGDINSDLIDAAWNGQTEDVKALIEAGADVNAKRKDGETVLMSAAWKGHTETVKALIEAGADLNAKRYRVVCLLASPFVRLLHRSEYGCVPDR